MDWGRGVSGELLHLHHHLKIPYLLDQTCRELPKGFKTLGGGSRTQKPN